MSAKPGNEVAETGTCPVAANPASALTEVREALAAAGRDSAGFQVTAPLPAVKSSDGGLDLDRTMEGVPPLVEAGITDFRAALRIPEDRGAATETLAEVVAAFRRAVGRAA